MSFHTTALLASSPSQNIMHTRDCSKTNARRPQKQVSELGGECCLRTDPLACFNLQAQHGAFIGTTSHVYSPGQNYNSGSSDDWTDVLIWITGASILLAVRTCSVREVATSGETSGKPHISCLQVSR